MANEETELYKKHRPSLLKDMKGQKAALQMVKQLLEKGLPHAILFSGPSGCGKTTLARILRGKLKCHPMDFRELNCADFRGIDMVRDLRSQCGLAPIGGTCRIYLIDECHQLSTDAQNAFLKMLEDTPKHVYFFFATTHPQKLLPTIKTRMTEVKLGSLTADEILALVEETAKEEKITLHEEVVEKITDLAEGSARKALVLLQQVLHIKTPTDQLLALGNADHKRMAVEIGRALLDPGTKWQQMSAILKNCDEDAESIRHLVLAYASSVMLNSPKQAPRCYVIINAFRDPFYESKRAGLVAACYEVIQ